MANPTQSAIHVNAPLTNISVAYLQSETSFVAGRVFPSVPVSKQSDLYYTYERGEFMRNGMKKRAAGTESAGSGYKVDRAPYYCDVWALHKDVADQQRANADTVIQLDREAAEWLSQQALIAREVEFATNYLASGAWTFEYTGVSGTPSAGEARFWNEDLSDPIKDIRLAMTEQQKATGRRPNTIVMGREVFDVLIDHPELVDRVKYGTQSMVSTVDVTELRSLWKIERVFVMDGVENLAQEGQVEDNAFISGKSLLLCHAAPRPGLMTPSAGYDFRWTGLIGSTDGTGATTSKFRMDTIKSDRIELEMAFDLKQVSADMGTLFDGIVE